MWPQILLLLRSYIMHPEHLTWNVLWETFKSHTWSHVQFPGQIPSKIPEIAFVRNPPGNNTLSCRLPLLHLGLHPWCKSGNLLLIVCYLLRKGPLLSNPETRTWHVFKHWTEDLLQDSGQLINIEERVCQILHTRMHARTHARTYTRWPHCCIIGFTGWLILNHSYTSPTSNLTLIPARPISTKSRGHTLLWNTNIFGHVHKSIWDLDSEPHSVTACKNSYHFHCLFMY